MEDATTGQSPPSVGEVVAARVTAWPGVTAAPSPTGARAFRLGSQELGHVHRSGLLDIQFDRHLRDRLVADGVTGPHPLDPTSTWTSFRVTDADDVDHAVWLLRVAYLATLATTPGPLARRARATVDLDAELAALPPTIRAAVPTRG